MKFAGKHTEDVANRILGSFQNPESLPQALSLMFIHRKDEVPCRNWSWHNQLLVAMCGTTDARGIRQWNQAGRRIKRGAKAIWILAPWTKRITEENEHGEEIVRDVLIGFRSIPVFPVECTEGDELPDEDGANQAWINSLPLVEVAHAWDIHVNTYSFKQGCPLGYFAIRPDNQRILLGVENISTWAHELVHAADYRVTGLQGSRPYKEIVAEFGAAVLLEILDKSHEADLGGAYAYITRYAEETDKPVVKACIEVLDRVCNCVKLILDTAEATPVPEQSVSNG